MNLSYIFSLTELDAAAEWLLSTCIGQRKFAFIAPMGSGKTTFIEALCRHLGTTDALSSPTYAIANEYHTLQGGLLYHLDLYRLNRIEEAYELGVEEYIDHSSAYCFVEWPELIMPLLDNFVQVQISVMPDQKRRIEVLHLPFH